jgi:hypothetical protein
MYGQQCEGFVKWCTEKRVENYNEHALLICLNQKSRGNFLLLSLGI